MSTSPDTALNRLMRGISTDHVQTVREAWLELLDAGHAATPLVRQKLYSDVWRKKPLGPSARYLGLLLALLHELDVEEFKKEVQRLLAAPLHPLHRHTVKMMAKRRGDRVFGRVGEHVPVYISREIKQPDVIFRYVQRWSRTRDLALSGVTRIDIIAFHSDMDYLGLYNLFYDGIVLTWRNDVTSGVAKWWQKTMAEVTFYHEVGHHHFQHSERGQIAEQEREADQYMRRMLRNAHPILIPVLTVVFSPVLKARELLKKRSIERS